MILLQPLAERTEKLYLRFGSGLRRLARRYGREITKRVSVDILQACYATSQWQAKERLVNFKRDPPKLHDLGMEIKCFVGFQKLYNPAENRAHLDINSILRRPTVVQAYIVVTRQQPAVRKCQVPGDPWLTSGVEAQSWRGSNLLLGGTSNHQGQPTASGNRGR